MTATSIKRSINAGLTRAARALTDDRDISATIVRRSGADESTYPPVAGSDTSYTCRLLMFDYMAGDRDGTNITARDGKAMVAPDAETDPRNGDKLVFAGKTYSIVNVYPFQPGGDVLYWNVQIRSGDE